jgi:hypothetical protein
MYSIYFNYTNILTSFIYNNIIQLYPNFIFIPILLIIILFFYYKEILQFQIIYIIFNIIICIIYIYFNIYYTIIYVFNYLFLIELILLIFFFFLIKMGELGIEPNTPVCKTDILPINYTPFY